MATARTFTGQTFLLTLEDVVCGTADTVDGGGITADVVEEKAGGKHIGSAAYEPLTVETGLALSHDVYDWIAASWSGNVVRKNGSITTADAQANAKSEQRWQNALPTAVTFDAFDAASKEPVRLTLAITAERVQDLPATGKTPLTGGTPKQKQALASSFRLELDGVDCTHVRRIDSFTVQVEVVEDPNGTTREPLKLMTHVDFPNLSVTLADDATAASWRTWVDDFIVNGDNAAAKEKSGALVLLAPDLKTELARIELHGVGICRLARSKRSAGADAIPTLVAELYCQGMTLQVGTPAPAPAPPTPAPAPTPHKLDPTHPVTPLRG
jgi:hypothetical protein